MNRLKDETVIKLLKENRAAARQCGREEGRREILEKLRKIKDRNRPEVFGYIVAQLIEDGTLLTEGAE